MSLRRLVIIGIILGLGFIRGGVGFRCGVGRFVVVGSFEEECYLCVIIIIGFVYNL